MNDIVFEVVKLAVMVAVFAVSTYMVPWIRGKIGNEKIAAYSEFISKCVLAAQQLYWSQTGEERKAKVKEWVSAYCTEHRLTITEEQIDILIESAVKEMKLSSPASVEQKADNNCRNSGYASV